MNAKCEQLIYFSLWRPQTSPNLDAALAEILSISTDRNARADITGALLCCNGWFVQVLEGAQVAIAELYERIERDPRHESVTLVGTREVDQRDFPNWSMCGARLSPADDAILKVLGRQISFSPPEMTFEVARDVLGVVHRRRSRRRSQSA